jgi:hypothetical protein
LKKAKGLGQLLPSETDPIFNIPDQRQQQLQQQQPNADYADYADLSQPGTEASRNEPGFFG